LTPDEQQKIDHLTKDLDPFLEKHPDLAEEAAKKRAGIPLPKGDHPGEAEEIMKGVQNDIDHLEAVRRSRTTEAQTAIDQAIEEANKWLEHMNELLYGDE